MGNPNPSPETRFKPGNSLGGKTSAQRKLEYEAAEMAAFLRHAMLSDITELVKNGKRVAFSELSPDLLRLMKDSEDRAFGTPKQSVEHSGDAESPLVLRVIERRIVRAGGE